jgi:hypothetical protein
MFYRGLMGFQWSRLKSWQGLLVLLSGVAVTFRVIVMVGWIAGVMTMFLAFVIVLGVTALWRNRAAR